MNADQRTDSDLQAATTEFFRAKLFGFVRAAMLIGKVPRSTDKTEVPPELSEAYQTQCAELAKRFGHLVKDEFSMEMPVRLAEEMLPTDQIEAQNDHHHLAAELQLTAWFGDDVNEQKKCIDALTLWMLIYFFSTEETKQRIIEQLRTIEDSRVELTAPQVNLLESLAYCYHIRMFFSMFIATLNANQIKQYDKEVAMEKRRPSSEGLNVGLMSNAEPRFSHCRFREYMALVHHYPIFSVVDMVPTSPCFLCNDALPARPIGSIMLSYPGVDEQNPEVELPAEGDADPVVVDRGRVQRIVCPNCAVGLESWWAVYHFVDVILRKKLEVYVKNHEGRSLRELHSGFLDERRTELINLFRSKTRAIYQQYAFYFREKAPFEDVHGMFVKQDVFAKELHEELYDAMRFALESSITKGLKHSKVLNKDGVDLLTKRAEEHRPVTKPTKKPPAKAAAKAGAPKKQAGKTRKRGDANQVV